MSRGLAFAWLSLLMACGAQQPTRLRTARDAPSAARRSLGERGLDAAEMRVRERLRGLDWEPLPALVEGFFANAQGTTLAVRVAPGQCVVWIAVGTRGLADLDATLYAPSGRSLATDREEDAHPTVVACAGERERALYYRVSAYRGVGAYRVLRYRAPERELSELERRLGGRPAISPSADAIESSSLLAEWIAGAEARGFAVRGAARLVSMEGSARLRVPLPVAAGSCVSVLAAAHGELESVSLVLRDEADVVRAEGPASGRGARLQACPRRDGDWTLEIGSAAGRGEAEIIVMVAEQRDVGAESALWWGARPHAPLPEPSGPVFARGRLAAGEVQRVRVSVRAGRCVILRASGDASLGALELAAAGAAARSSEVPSGLRVCRRRGQAAPIVRVSARGPGAYRLFGASSAPQDRSTEEVED